MDVIDLIIRHEGLRLKPYRDTLGNLTIGVGRCLDMLGITREESIYLLKNDIARVVGELSQSFSWFQRLSDVRQAAIVDMALNLGLTHFRTFTAMIQALDSDDYESAAREMLSSRWGNQVGFRAHELAQMIRSGEFPT